MLRQCSRALRHAGSAWMQGGARRFSRGSPAVLAKVAKDREELSARADASFADKVVALACHQGDMQGPM